MERLSRHGSQLRAWSAGGRVMVMRLVMTTALLLPQIAPAMGAPERPGCFIRLARAGQVMHLSAYVETTRPLTGSYQLIVGKQGISGLSRNTQRGDFRAPAPDGAAVLLGTVSVRLTGDESVRAELTIRTGESVICQAVL
ncbi:curli-like amyloid fiber formation chaperone CsgH [Roseicyclus sp.]|uniref:curli-like amyloid fiber formation chaperone CsgH n=1 Tax=Roseicyclus sp. TaxID=1914329 RepID=UPI003F6C9B07